MFFLMLGGFHFFYKNFDFGFFKGFKNPLDHIN